ncbi:hypothetical protein ABIE58_000591 [Roseovarius sp. MBR-78]|jgi:hypothetical protein|uniref:DUF2513 domain-containing protein n=1 Tax=Roseovarius sp. MBR-78 TaxID=3156460 RepID=UPI003395EF88
MAKRDLDRMREILLHVESGENPSGWFEARGDRFFVDADEYQIALLEQAGFLETDFGTLGSAIPDDVRITFPGHDYLDAIRSESIWQETKDAVADTGGNATLEILKALAVGLLKKKIAQHTGIEIG